MKPKIYKMIHCSNPGSVGMQYVGVTSPLVLDVIFRFSDMYSSTIQSVTRTEDEILVITKNTEYTFKEVKS